MADKSKLLINSLKKIPIFDALPPNSVNLLVSLCEPRSLKEGEELCTGGTPSDEMYILLAGELSVTTEGGMLVATLTPVTTVGEMGVITGQPRSATVTAVRACRVLVLKRDCFDTAIQDDAALNSRVMRNFIEILARRVADDNVRLREFVQDVSAYRSTAAGMESRLKLHEQRTELALDLVVASGGERDQATHQMDEQILAQAPRVLVVDDEPDFRDLVRRTLSYCAVREAADGQQALTALEQEMVQVVVTDIRMPVMDGMELAKNLLRLYPALSIVGVSGFVGPDEVEEATFGGFMSKPIAVTDFRALIEVALDNSS